MNRIHVLDPATVSRIAAGEVVERPASVVKELIENAMDAGASRVTVEIADGGKKLIRVTDDGRGIEAEDVPLAFLQHATSKIKDAEDLSSIGSYGFRGEALSSIAAVSRVELITKRAEDLSATRYLIEGGREKKLEEVGAPEGTTILIRDLFFNTPARAKFLKTGLTESAKIGGCVEELAISRPDISFTFISGGQEKLRTSGTGSLRDALRSVYGRGIPEQILPIPEGEGRIRVTGFIGKPEFSRGNRTREHIFVNGRLVRSSLISRAVEDGFGTRLMQHQYPLCAVNVETDGHEVDVNVHPAKLEVRFSDEKLVYDAVRAAVSAAFAGEELIPSGALPEAGGRAPAGEGSPVSVTMHAGSAAGGIPAAESGAAEAGSPADGGRKKPVRPPEAFERRAEALLRKALPEEDAPESEAQAAESEAAGTTAPDPTVTGMPAVEAGAWPNPAQSLSGRRPEQTKAPSGTYVQQSFMPDFLSEEAAPLRRIAGQIFSTYWIVEYGDEVMLFDQHAAHERILYERFMRAYRNREITSQQLSPPIVISLGAVEESLLASYLAAFEALGFEIEPFGGRDYAVRAVPHTLEALGTRALFTQMLEQLERSTAVEDLDVYVHRVATEACKAAVKGGRRISEREASALLAELMSCEDPYHCPHGRPTIISFKRSDVEKRFRRIV